MGIQRLECNEITEKVKKLPFKSKLSFLPIIRHWEKLAKEGSAEEKNYADAILSEVDKVPAIRKPLSRHKSFIKKNRELVDKLMSAVFPPALHLNEIKAAYSPFEFETFKESPRYQKLVEINGAQINVPMNMDQATFKFARYIHACLFILGKYYHSPHNLETPFIYKIPDPDTGLDQYFKMTINGDFVDVKVKGEARKLSKEAIDHMVKNVMDIDLWLKNLPPDSFELTGFVIANMVNVTLHEVISDLKNNLLERDSILTDQYFKAIRHNVRSLFKIPDLRVGLGIYKDGKTISNFGHWSWRDLVCKGRIDNIQDAFEGSIYHRLLKTGEAVIIENIDELDETTAIEEAIKETCVKSLVVAPLKYHDEIIGYLELGSCEPNALTTFLMTRVHDILPLFSVALKRSLEERENMIGAIIMEKFTAIHHSVQWKFNDVAKKYLRNKDQGVQDLEVEPIVFEDVYPLYGMADIRDSSHQRNLAIQNDLSHQLELSQQVIQKALQLTSFPILEEFNYRINNLKKEIKKRLRSEDESKVHRLLQEELEPLFDFLQKDFPEVAEEITKYHDALDSKLGVVYQQRKLYEQSVTKINQTISEFLDGEEVKAQQMYPHYFEKYKTDGVDYNIYVGQSLLKDGTFNQVCLHNMRLWQLLMMIEMTKQAAHLVPKLPIPLETAQLILVHDDPLAIRFRIDEKKFDVDGAYNIRYEIVKKRIDKAFIKGTQKRLTQPGKIAIVYSSSHVEQEYMKYCDYLEHKGLIEKEVEKLELEAAQGVTGLKALRIKVRMKNRASFSNSEIEEIISSLQ